uniref:Uncharacterized protein n=1 Tax=Tanacetum cinerariifolium TaxID=118510 RepID=A0A6L2KEZ0_TANCI|nr:hypothetical protein [Tanacetum cinerariifolium]
MSQEYWSSEVKYVKRPIQVPKCVLVCPKVGFKPAKQVFKPVSKKPIANTSGNKKKDVEPIKEVSKSNPFVVLNSVENDLDLGDHDIEDEVKSADNDMTRILALVNVIFGTNSLLEQQWDSYENADYYYDPNEDDIHDG